MSTTPSTFISGLYTNVLRRSVAAGTATNAELLSWDALVTANLLTQTQVTSAIVNSVEATTFVAPIVRIYQTFFNRVPDTAGLTFWSTQLRNGTSLASISSQFSTAAEFTAAYGTPSASTIDSFLSALYTNVLGRTADATGFAFWKAQFAAQGSNAAAAAAIANSFSSSAEFTTSSATNITNLLTAAASTGSLGTGALGGATGSATGTTFNFTSSIESFTGTSANDTFQGTQANFGSLDTINGGAGTDTLSLLTTAAALTLSSGNISSIETINISASTNAVTATIAGLTGISTVSNSSSTVDVTFGAADNTGGLAAVPALNVSSNGTNNTTVNLTDTAVAGTADALTVTLTANGGGTITLNNTTADAIGLETINIVSSGTTANTTTIASVADTNNPVLNISGSANLTLTVGTTLTTTARTISASAATGNLTVTGLGAAVHTITGGSGNDSFDFGANFVGAENATVANRDTYNGGAGRDSILLNSATAVAASAATQTTVTNVEIVQLNNAAAGNIDITKFVGADTLNFGAFAVGAHTFTFNTGSTAVFTATAAGNNARSFVVGGTATTDVLNVTTVAGSNLGTAEQTFTGVETLNISTGTGVAGTAVTLAGALTLSPTAGGTGSIVVAGVNGLTLNSSVVTAASLNASALTGAVLMDTAAAIAISITGGSAADTLHGSTGSDLIVGGAGADTIVGRAGNDILTGGAGADDFRQLTAVNNGTDNITDFVAGTGGDKFTISVGGTGAGQSQLRNGAGNASVANAAAVGIKEVTAATTLVAADNVIVLTGTFATAAAVQTAIEAGGTRALTFANATTAGDDILVIWSDGTSGHISNVNIASAATTITASNATVVDHATLAGVTTITAGQFVAANFAFIT